MVLGGSFPEGSPFPSVTPPVQPLPATASSKDPARALRMGFLIAFSWYFLGETRPVWPGRLFLSWWGGGQFVSEKTPTPHSGPKGTKVEKLRDAGPDRARTAPPETHENP
jgi:hypothetical protein